MDIEQTLDLLEEAERFWKAGKIKPYMVNNMYTGQRRIIDKYSGMGILKRTRELIDLEQEDESS